MKNTLSVLFTVLFLSTSSILFAQSINIETAKEIASKHLMSVNQRNLKSASTGQPQLQVAFTSTENEDRDTLFYIVNDNTNNGFVIVASDKREWPILGYSTEGKYDGDNLPPAFIEWMEGMKNEIAYIKANNIQADPKISQEWNKLSSKTPYQKNGASSVGPLLQTKWNQGCYYNGLCPEDAQGQCNRAYTGCVATSMAQIMKYWNFPTTGTGSHNYNHSSYGTLSANFGSTTYQWLQMPNSVSSENDAVATLIYHCGVSVEMDYGPSSSGAHLSEEAMVNYFNYSPKVRYVYKRDYLIDDWVDLLKSELNAKRPIYYSGFNTESGHAFVCDGYNESDYFHFNWGWGGTADGYFSLGTLEPAGHNYNSDQAAGIGIFPTSLPAGYNGFFLSDNTINMSANKVSDSLTISSSVAWNASSNESWLTLSTSTGVSGTSTLTLTAIENNTGSVRSANITISAGTYNNQIVTVYQNKKIAVTAGNLNTVLAGVLATTSNLTLTGTIDARDFKTMRDSMTLLAKVDLSLVNIVAYTGTLGTAYSENSETYPENEIPKLALFNKYKLTSVGLPQSTTSIGFQALDYCTRLTTLTIPSSVTSIKSYAFNHCTGLQSIVSQKPTPVDLSSSTSVFSNVNKTTCKLYVPYGSAALYAAANQWEEFSIIETPGIYPNSNSLVFSSKSAIEKLKIASSVAWTASSDQGWLSISPASGTMGSNSISLSVEANTTTSTRTAKVTLSATGFDDQVINITQYGLIEVTAGNLNNVLAGVLNTTTNLALIGTIDARDFKTMRDSMSVLAKVDLSLVTIVAYEGTLGTISTNNTIYPKDVIPRLALFNKNSLTSLDLPQSATSIGFQAVDFCRELTTLTIPSSVTSIKSYAFENCKGLQSIVSQKPTPVDLSSSNDVFLLVNKTTCKLYVPYGSAALYAAANQWEEFEIILELPGFSLARTTSTIGAKQNRSDSIIINSNTTWATSSNQSWLTVSPASGSENDTLVFTAAQNQTIATREATITVSAEGITSQIITVTQQAADIILSVSSTVKNIAKEAGSKDSIFVTSNTSWTANSDQLWLVLEPESGLGNDTLIFTAEANPLSTTRIAKVTIAAVDADSQIITVTQEAGDILLSVSSTVKNIAKEAGSKDSVFVTSNTEWTAVSNQLWLVLEPENGSGNNILEFTAEENQTLATREATITVSANGIASQIITVTQQAGSAISDNFEIDNTTISNGESTCFNAYFNIIVAENSAVIFKDGSSVNLIAGQSIRFLPGFHAEQGSFMNATITLDNSFCDSRAPSSSPIVTQPEKKNLKNEKIIIEKTILKAEKSIKVYPNPNNGNFTIELTNFENKAEVFVYNMLGARIFKSSIEDQSNLNINLPEINKGLYFVKVIGENEQFTKKIVVN